MNNIRDLISTKLRGLRAEKKLSLDEVAQKLNIHRETFRKYETNPLLMNTGIFLEVLEIYEMNPTIFFEQIYGKMS